MNNELGKNPSTLDSQATSLAPHWVPPLIGTACNCLLGMEGLRPSTERPFFGPSLQGIPIPEITETSIFALNENRRTKMPTMNWPKNTRIQNF